MDLDTDNNTGSEEQPVADSSGPGSMSLSAAATTGTTSKKTMRLLGICNTQVLILVDSGSSWNFINKDYCQWVQDCYHKRHFNFDMESTRCQIVRTSEHSSSQML